MDVLMGDYAYFERFARQYEWVYAHSHELKQEVYRLRALQMKQPLLMSVIDEHDAAAHHFFIRDRTLQQGVAASRLMLLSGQALRKRNLPRQVNPASSGPRIATLHSNTLEISEMGTTSSDAQHLLDSASPPAVLDLGMYLGATSLARLLFHDMLLVTLPIDRFKQFRALGLQFEYAGELSGNVAATAHFYLDLRQDIRPSSPLSVWQQTISEQFAPWVNMPLLQENEA